MLAVLLNDVDGRAIDERIIVPHNIMRIQLPEDLDFLQCLHGRLFWQQRCVNFLNDV